MIRGVARYVKSDQPSRRTVSPMKQKTYSMLGDDGEEEEDHDNTDNDGVEIKPRRDFRHKTSDSGNDTGEVRHVRVALVVMPHRFHTSFADLPRRHTPK